MNLINKLRKRQHRKLGIATTVATVDRRLDRMAERVDRAAGIVGITVEPPSDPISDLWRYRPRVSISSTSDTNNGGNHA